MNVVFSVPGQHMGVSKNNGTPKSSILIGFSIINHPFWGTPIFGNTHIRYYSETAKKPAENPRFPRKSIKSGGPKFIGKKLSKVTVLSI